MDKKYLLILLALFMLIIISKRSTAAPKPKPQPEINLGYGTTFYSVVSGDTLYKLAEWIYPTEIAGPKTREKVLNFARQIAIANGFNWDLYDDKASNDLKDPDTLKPGQKIVLYTWGSFNENDPRTGALMPGQQVNAFNSFDILL